ncbi:phosphatidate cytidylyltransferase [Metamycoplasma subdolum]|nr:phosphatidate cytidylyltransferase [Metamycoplasma subdolum]WPB50478.1 phosphatidate cytidylyltransferase [Metamycoplasma subdolum]
MIFFTLVIPIVLLNYFVKYNEIRLFSLLFYSLFCVYATYEILQHNKLHFYANCILSATALLPLFLTLPVWDSKTSSTIFEGIRPTLNISDALNLNRNWMINLNLWWISFLIGPVVSSLFFLTNIYYFKSKKEFFANLFVTFFVTTFMPLFSKLLWFFNTFNIYAFAVTFFIPVVVDVSGYFGGKAFGRKLIKRRFSKISPNKTWEGAIISYVLGTIATVALIVIPSIVNAPNYFSFYSNLWKKIITPIILPIISIIGDLTFSMFKRFMRVKDFSNLIPGHGGLMDRFDAMSFVMSSTYIILII